MSKTEKIISFIKNPALWFCLFTFYCVYEVFCVSEETDLAAYLSIPVLARPAATMRGYAFMWLFGVLIATIVSIHLYFKDKGELK